MTTNNVLEQIQFRLKENVLESDFILASDQINQWVQQQAGFIYRSLAKSTDGLWTDIYYWNDMESADAANKVFPTVPECQALMSAILEESVIMQHLDIVSQSCDFSQKEVTTA